MKKFWTVFALIFTLALSIAPAEAKRLGGGKSFGKSHQTAPAKSAPQKQDAAPAADKPNAGSGISKKGLMGGMLGGLLAGGLIGYMLGNGGFEGIQLMDILLIGLVVLVIVMLFKRMAKPAAAAQPSPAYARTSHNDNAPAPSALAPKTTGRTPLVTEIGGFAAPSVPMNLPSGFDLTAFLVGARDHYRTLQEAWNKNDFSVIEEYVSTELFTALKAERSSLAGEQHTEVLFVDAQLVRADHSAVLAELSLKFTGRYRDTQENIEEDIQDIWHLERDLSKPNAPWLVVGIEG